MPEIIEEAVPCVHFGQKKGNRWVDNDTGVGIYLCSHPNHKETTIEKCWGCYDFVASEDLLPIKPQKVYEPCCGDKKPYLPNLKKPPELLSLEQQVLTTKRLRQKRELPTPSLQPKDLIVNRSGNPAFLADLYQDASLFLILSGPSLLKHDLTRLNQRGILTMGVNNSPSVFRTNLWTCVDPCIKFHHSIWFDPYILKFVPQRFFRDSIRIKKDNTFEKTKQRISSLPNVLGYKRSADFNPKNWLYQETVNWGNSKKSAEHNQFPRVLNVMFPALRIPFHLGFRKIYLLGCDFQMLNGTQNYAFTQARDDGAVASNNQSYSTVAYFLSLLKPHFEEQGYQVFNCNKDSKLKLFPYLSFNEAVKKSIAHVDQILDTDHWYEKT